MPIYNDEIQTSSVNNDPWRIQRLERAIGYVQACIDLKGDSPFLNKIKSLHDHKGTLTVCWKVAPIELEKKFFNEAWISAIGDGANNVEHKTEQ